MHHVAHRELGDLAGLRARDVGDGDDLRRHVPGRRTGPDLGADRLLQRLVQHHAIGEPTKSTTLTSPSQSCRCRSPRRSRPSVRPGCRSRPSYADAARIVRRIRAAVDDHSPVLGPFGEVAVAPDVREAVENRRRDTSRRSGRSRNMTASTGTAACKRVHPSPDAPGARRRPRHRSPLPRPGPWISPIQTGRSGMPSTKQATTSVPPEIEARWTSALMPS